MSPELRISRLVDHVHVVPTLVRWFETEWPDYYGPGGPGHAHRDLMAYARRDDLPIGVVAFLGDQPCGIAALKRESIDTHAHLTPWAAAGLVAPEYRGQGIGASLLVGLEDVARDLGYSRIYCATSTAVALLERAGWIFLEFARQRDEIVAIYQKSV